MKKIYALIVTLFVTITTLAQEKAPYLWPILGEKAGTDIIYAPQSYIDKELNFGALFIGAKEGAVVVAPTDGTISHISLKYLENLVYSTAWGYDKSFNNSLKLKKENIDKKIDPKYLTGSICINAGGGKSIYISGLTGDIEFKTGQRVRRGDTLGYVSYSYRKIKEPSINLSISQNSIPADPMSSFGIKSSFIPPGEIKPIKSLTKEQAKEDFEAYIACLKEAYPGLYNVVTEDELTQYVTETIRKINSFSGDIPFSNFLQIMRGTVAKIHDSHIYMHSVPKQQRKTLTHQPQVFIGWINDTLICTNATKEYEHLIGKQILRVNNIVADSAKKIVADATTSYDSKVQEYINYNLATMGFSDLFSFSKNPDTYDLALEMADGGSFSIKGQSIKGGMPKYIHNLRDFMSINWYRDMYLHKMLNDSTAYIGLTTFQLNEVQVEDIANFIDSISKAGVPNLIFDVRNNGGGHVEVLEKLYSYVAGEPMSLRGYSKVNKLGRFETFKHSTNYSPDFDTFTDYHTEEGRDGFYQRTPDGHYIMADSTINYKGHLYVLTNENSISAATLFPAMTIRNHRGVVVGRETRTAYHFMNALKFADIRLPNSTICITIPLVEICFDTVVNERAPYGRGVIPDYHVPFTAAELHYNSGDAILNYTLKLIKEEKYLSSKNPFALQEEENQSSNTNSKTLYALFTIGGAIIIGLVIFLFSKKKKYLTLIKVEKSRLLSRLL